MSGKSQYPYRCSRCEHEFKTEYNPGRAIRCPRCFSSISNGADQKSKYDVAVENKKKIEKMKIIIEILVISMLSVYGTYYFIDLSNTGESNLLSLTFGMGLVILTLGHELLHIQAWKYFGYKAEITMVLPGTGRSRGPKPKSYGENFIISMAPLLLTIISLVLYFFKINSFESESYLSIVYINTMGMVYDAINAIKG